ncbi:MAG: dockerin type I repeat-containing protein [Microgenomates group bacterium]
MINKILKKLIGLLSKQDGLAQIPLMIGLLLMALAIPVATQLSQQNQANQGKAASCPACYDGMICSAQTGYKCIVPGTKPPTATPTKKLAATATPKPAGCVSNGTCAKATCSNQTCVDNCGKTVQGTKVCTAATATPKQVATIIPTVNPTKCTGNTTGRICDKGSLYTCLAYNNTPQYFSPCVSGKCAADGTNCAPMPTSTPTIPKPTATPIPQKCYCSTNLSSGKECGWFTEGLYPVGWVTGTGCGALPTNTPKPTVDPMACSWNNSASRCVDGLQQVCECVLFSSCRYKKTTTACGSPTPTILINECSGGATKCEGGRKSVCQTSTTSGAPWSHWVDVGTCTPTATPTKPTKCNSWTSEGFCSNKAPGDTCMRGSTAGYCSGVAGGACTCLPGTPTSTPKPPVEGCSPACKSGETCVHSGIADRGTYTCVSSCVTNGVCSRATCTGQTCVDNCGKTQAGIKVCVVTNTPTKIPTATPTRVTSCYCADNCNSGQCWKSSAAVQPDNGKLCPNSCGRIVATATPRATATPTRGSGGNTATNTPTIKPTATPGGNGGGNNSCKECPKVFNCYQNGNEYQWFVNGYAMNGFTKVAEAKCSGVTKPTFKGKGKGDANCDGSIDVTDYSLWHKEFFDGNKGADSSKNWNADFTGPKGKCDGVVDVYDFSLWQKYFSELF